MMKKGYRLTAALAVMMIVSPGQFSAVAQEEPAAPAPVVTGKMMWTHCPLVLPWNGTAFEEEVVFLTGFDGPDKAGGSTDPLEKIKLDPVPRVLVREKGKETAYIDQLRLRITLKKGKVLYLDPAEASRDVQDLVNADGKAVAVTADSELMVEFKPLKKSLLSRVTMVELEAKGYYEKK